MVIVAVHFICGCVDCLHGDCKFLEFVLSSYVSVNTACLGCLSLCCEVRHRQFCQIPSMIL